jgi:hypothetical protein
VDFASKSKGSVTRELLRKEAEKSVSSRISPRSREATSPTVEASEKLTAISPLAATVAPVTTLAP